MTRVLAMALLLGFLTATGRADDDRSRPDQPEPPVRLKKKAKPNEDTDKDKKPELLKKETTPKEEKEGDEPAIEPEQDPKEIIGRISKNMENSKDRLAQKDTGDGTQQVQRDIIKDLDDLINQSSRRQQQQQQQQQQSEQSSRSRRQRSQRPSQKQNAGQAKQQASGQNRGQPNQPNQKNNGQNPGAGGAGGKKDSSPNADLYKDIWGHLPETLRKEMDAYSRVEFMSKYNDMLKQYYSTISEKGRRKGD